MPSERTVRWAARAPILATALLEYANVGQLWRMWHDRTSAGQELTAWISVFFALVAYQVFYRVVIPEQKWPARMNAVGIAMNIAVVLTVLYFRRFA